MKTFVGEYKNGNFSYSGDIDSIRMQLISILNTPLGSRFYFPSYGSKISDYRFNVINYFTINMIGQEIKRVVDLIDGVSLTDIQYNVQDNTIIFDMSLSRLSDIIKIRVSVSDGVAY